MKNNSLETPLKHAEELGSAHHGSGHWLILRITSLALLPLTVWFVVTVIRLSKVEQPQLVGFFQSPINALLMALLIAFSFYHTALGLQEVVEDYVHKKFTKATLLLIINLGLLALGILTIMAIVKMHF